MKGRLGACRFHRTTMGLLLLVYLLLAGWYSIRIPVGEGVDEAAHFAYVRYLKETRSLPVQPRQGEPIQVWMGHHPPLYYLMGALLIVPIGTEDFEDVLRPNPHFVWAENDGTNGWNVMLHFGQEMFPWRGSVLGLHIVRLLSVLLGGIAVVASYYSVHLLIPEHPWAPLGATSVVAFNPSFVFMSSTVHHDVLVTTIFSLGILWALRTLSAEDTTVHLSIGGLLGGAAILTKLTGVMLLPVFGLALVLRAWLTCDWKRVMPRCFWVFGIALALGGWWFVRNQALYGDPLGWEVFRTIFHFNLRETEYSWRLFRYEFLGQLGRTFWGAFGFMHITFPQVTRYLWYFCGLSLLGLPILLLTSRKKVLHDRTILKWSIPAASLLLVFVALVRFSVESKGAGHARYVFPASTAIGGLIVVGLNGFSRWRHEHLISALLTVAMLAYSIWLPSAFLFPKYSAPEMARAQEVEQAIVKSCVFGNAVELIGYAVEPALAIPDTWLSVTFYWRGFGSPGRRPDVYAHARLVDDSNRTLDSVRFWPSRSTTPAVWQSGQIMVTRESLHVPPWVHAGNLHIEVILTEGRQGPSLPVVEKGSDSSLGSVRLGPILCAGQAIQVDREIVTNRRAEIIGSGIGLAGHQLPQDDIHAGETLVVPLFWQVLEPSLADYTVFVHVVSHQGELVAQFDGPPGGTRFPTSSWKPGQVLLASYPVALPETLAAGHYRILVGLYTWPSLEREPVFLEGRQVGDAILVGTVEVR